MKISRRNTAANAIALSLILVITASLVALPAANAHTPPWEIPNFCYVMPGPRVVGVGQEMTFVMWSQLPPGSSATNTVRWRNFTLVFTKPDGQTQVLQGYDSDPTGSTYALYKPDKVGNWTVKLILPRQVLTTTGTYGNDTWKEAAYTTTFTVQEDPVQEVVITYPLPTEFWTRPIEGQNDQWYRVASNWLRGVQVGGIGAGSDRVYQPGGSAPNSGHIMWTTPLDFAGGIVGGINTGVEGNAFYDGSFYNLRFRPIIMNGKLYYELPLYNSGGGGGFMCRDLVTGEQIWYSDKIGVSGSAAPSFGYLYAYEYYNQHGVIPPGLLFTTNFANAIDPASGKILFNVTGVPSGTETHGPAGEILRTRIYNNGTTANPQWLMSQWNSSKVFTDQNSGLINATLATPAVNHGYDWNVTIDFSAVGKVIWSNTGANSPTVQAVQLNDVLLGSNGSAPSRGGEPDTRPEYVTFWAISLKPESRGRMMWMKNIPNAPNNLTMYWPARAMVDGVFVLNIKETQQWIAYSMYTGNLLWGPTEPETNYNPYAYFSGTVAVTQVSTCAYGMFFSAGYSGMVFAYNLTTGELLWRYEAPTNRSTWQYYPLMPLAIADGKLYLGTNEHSSSKPLFKGNKIRCLNVTDGTEIWTLTGWGGLHSGAVADGTLVYYNGYDNQIYCIGKGPSGTTVTGPEAVQPLGTPVLLKGTVTDESPGSKIKGTAAMSDESMDDWMSYMFMQKPRPKDAKGVEVSIDAVDPNNNFVHLGTATTDSTGMYSLMFTPEVPGKYTIIATFAGSESYWPSFGETAIGVDEAPPTPPEEPEAPPDMTGTYIMYATIAIIVAMALIGAFIVLILRRK